MKSSFCYPHSLPKSREGNHVITSKRSVLAKTGNASITDRTALLPVQLHCRPAPLKMMWHEVTMWLIFIKQLKWNITSSNRQQLTLGQNFFVHNPLSRIRELRNHCREKKRFSLKLQNNCLPKCKYNDVIPSHGTVVTSFNWYRNINKKPFSWIHSWFKKASCIFWRLSPLWSSC